MSSLSDIEEVTIAQAKAPSPHGQPGGEAGLSLHHRPVAGNVYESISIDGHSKVHLGDIYFSSSQSIFGSLVEENRLQNTSAGDGTRQTLTTKARFQAGRRPPRTLEQAGPYTPYQNVTNRKIRLRLLQIAERFRFLDCGFAEYFQAVVPSFNRDHVRELLDDAHRSIAARQHSGQNIENGTQPIYLGDLGHYCEAVSKSWTRSNTHTAKYTNTYGRDQEILHYLQDAFEVPYWELMLELFLRWRSNSKNMSGDVLIYVLHSMKLDVLDGRRRLLDELEILSGDDKDCIAPILKGIDARLAVLESVWDAPTSNLEKDDFLASVFDRPLNSAIGTAKEASLPLSAELASSPNEPAILIALILTFLAAAIVPGYKAFAISMQDNKVGSRSDADFWYLIQSNIMAVLGNLVMVVPLIKQSWFSPAYTFMWTFFTLGLAFAGISITIYPYFNTGWSSLIAFFGSIASNASILVMTQATVRAARQNKLKND